MSLANRQQSSVLDRHVLARTICLVLLWASGAARAQMTTGDILGTITDPSGAVLPNVKIVGTNQGAQLECTTQSDSSGQYTFVLLPAREYSITASASGFKTFVLPVLTANLKACLVCADLGPAVNREMKSVVEDAAYDVMMGSSSEDIRLRGSFQVRAKEVAQFLSLH